MCAPRFILGLRAADREMAMRRCRTVCRLAESPTSTDPFEVAINDLREELRQFIDSKEFRTFVILTMEKERIDPKALSWVGRARNLLERVMDLKVPVQNNTLVWRDGEEQLTGEIHAFLQEKLR